MEETPTEIMFLENPVAKSELQELRIGDPLLLKFQRDHSDQKLPKKQKLQSQCGLVIDGANVQKEEAMESEKQRKEESKKSNWVLKITGFTKQPWSTCGENVIRKRSFEEEEEAANLKKQRKNCNKFSESESESEPPSPLSMDDKLKIRFNIMQDSGTMLVLRKKVLATDPNTKNNRFSMPLRKIKSEFMESGEMESQGKRIRIRNALF